MVNVYLVPDWFLNYTSLLDLLFALVAFLVCFYAFRVYKLSGQREPKIFGFGFLFIAISYLIQGIINYAMVSQMDNELLQKTANITNTSNLAYLGIYIYVILFIAGLITITYMTLKIKSMKAYSLLLILGIISLYFSGDVPYSFYLLSSILLGYIFVYYCSNYKNKRQFKTLLVLIAFGLLFLGNTHFVFYLGYQILFIVGHTLEMIAYIIILVNLILTVRR